jgi:hypothetical protein
MAIGRVELRSVAVDFSPPCSISEAHRRYLRRGGKLIKKTHYNWTQKAIDEGYIIQVGPQVYAYNPRMFDTIAVVKNLDKFFMSEESVLILGWLVQSLEENNPDLFQEKIDLMITKSGLDELYEFVKGWQNFPKEMFKMARVQWDSLPEDKRKVINNLLGK